MGQALVRPDQAQDARSLSRLLGGTGDGARDHELRVRGRRPHRLVGRGAAGEDGRVLAGRRRVQIPYPRLSRHHRGRFGAPARQCPPRGRTALSAEHAARAGPRAPARICHAIDRARRAAEVVQFDHRQLRDRGVQDRSRGRRDVSVRLAAGRQRLPARLPLRPAGGGHDDAARRTDGAGADQRQGEGRRWVAGFLASDPRRRASPWEGAGSRPP